MCRFVSFTTKLFSFSIVKRGVLGSKILYAPARQCVPSPGVQFSNLSPADALRQVDHFIWNPNIANDNHDKGRCSFVVHHTVPSTSEYRWKKCSRGFETKSNERQNSDDHKHRCVDGFDNHEQSTRCYIARLGLGKPRISLLHDGIRLVAD
jgi:hypothetical protein